MISKNILIDTDIGPDCDDVAALAMLNIYANRGLCRILGIGHCTSNVYGAGTIDAICRFYGRPDVEIGTYKAPGFLCDEKCIIYNKAITEEFPNRYRNHQPEDACTMYRRILAGQPDHSVEFIAIGPLNNLSDLLDSGADVYSPLSGKELVAQKVTRLVMMAGIFTAESVEANAMVKELTGHTAADMEEFNVVCNIPAARNVAENWPTPKEYLGFEAGMVQTGIPSGAGIGSEHPVKRAYELYTEDGRRYSWDLLTVEHAINDNCPHYKLSAPGHVRFDEKGRTVWMPDAQGGDRYVIWAQPSEKIETDINALLCSAE